MTNITGLNYQPHEQFTKTMGVGYPLDSDRVLTQVTTDKYHNFKSGRSVMRTTATPKYIDLKNLPKNFTNMEAVAIGAPKITVHRSVGVVQDAPVMTSKWQEYSEEEMNRENEKIRKPRTFYKPFEYVATVTLEDEVYTVRLYVSGHKVQDVKNKKGDVTQQVFKKDIVKNSYEFTFHNIIETGFLNMRW